MFRGPPVGVRNSMEAKDSRNDQTFDYFLILDFEATCDKKQPRPQEIIEFPVLKLNARTLEIESVFHQYVAPTEHPNLSKFCTELTGITQDMVENQPNLKETLKLFDDWLIGENLIAEEPAVGKKFIFVICGDWDLKTMLPGQCKFLQIPVPWYFHQWVNVKKPFSRVTGRQGRGMMPMLIMLDIQHKGKHHSGIDDCKNIAQIVRVLIGRKGAIFEPTGHLW